MAEYITIDNAADFVGKTVDCYRRLGHHYPIRVIQGVSGLYIVDRNGVMMPLNDRDAIAYDWIVGERQNGK